MTNQPIKTSNAKQPETDSGNNTFQGFSLENSREQLENITAEERIQWAHNAFGSQFVLTTSFGIQSAVLLNMIHLLQLDKPPKIIWIDTGYLPPETYIYANELTIKLQLTIEVIQSDLSPARMEALYGRLWENKEMEDLEKYHLIRKVKPLEKAFDELNVTCWASGVRGGQTKLRSSMTFLDEIRGRFSLRPLLNWTNKDVFYYMKEHELPQHPLFEKGYSTVGDWHSSGPDTPDQKGRNTRFGGVKEECGIHLPETNK